MISSFELLDASECAMLDRRIKELRAYWVPRGTEPASFFTLGAASYLDEGADYRTRAARLNPILRDSFAWLYSRVADFLARRVRAPVTMADDLAMPGFHIWLAPAIFIKPMASVHFDLQYMRAWPRDARLDLDQTLSFTLPIRLPRRGGGLNLWDVTYERFCRFYQRVPVPMQPADITVLLERMRHPYHVGGIAIHSGHLLHQIGEIDEVVPDDERITLQGHAVRHEGEWKLYW